MKESEMGAEAGTVQAAETISGADDATLLQRYAASGDRAAMDELFRRHTAAAYRLAKTILKNASDAEEIVQNVFIDVLRSAPSYRADASVKSWILKMIANKSISRIREESRRRQREQTVVAERDVASTPTEQAAEHAAVREHLAQLPDHYRLPIYLRYMEGLSTKEVAATLAVNEKTVYSQIERGIAQLQRSLIAAGITSAASAMVLPTLLSAVALEAPPVALTHVIATLVAQTPLPLSATATTAAPAAGKVVLTKTALVISGLAIIAVSGGALLLTRAPNASKVASTSTVTPAPVKLATLNVAANSLVLGNRVAYCIASAENKIYTIDLADPKSPRINGSVATQFPEPAAIELQDHFLYVAERGGSGRLEIFDVSKPTGPVSVGAVALLSGSPLVLCVQGSRAIVLQNDGTELGAYDISDPAAPKAVGAAKLEKKVACLQVQGRFAYASGLLSNSGYLAVFDISGSGAPTPAGSCSGWQYPNHLLVRDAYGYWPSGNLKLTVVDLSKPASPALINGVGPGFNGPRATAATGRMLYVVDRPLSGNDQLQTFDLAAPATPLYVQSFDLGLSNTQGIAADATTLYVVNGAALTTYDLGKSQTLEK